HPRLRVALLEAGAGWVPYFFERLDEHWEHRADEMPLNRRPSDYLANGQLFISTEGEDGLGHVVGQVGSGCGGWASGYPHWDARFPGAVKPILDHPELLEEDKAAILSGNAERLLGWSGARVGNVQPAREGGR